MAKIAIHEFSTGITFQGTQNNWVSTGDTGNYMNSTLAVIPTSVQMDISAGLFDLAEGTSSDTPALIGREVEDRGDAWSVLAVVTRAPDDGGRENPYYRFFLTQGLSRLPDLINWYIREARRPIYDPFDIKKVGFHNIYDNEQTKPIPSNFSQFDKYIGKRIIPHHDRLAELIIHYLAEKQGKTKIAWAYQVEGLEKPEYFQVIYPASTKAQETIEQQLNREPTQKQIVGNENYVKTAITNLINGQNITNQYIQDIVDALNNQNFRQEDWENSIFNKFTALPQPSNQTYSDVSIRLYFLRGLILPHTLPKFVEWLSHNKLTRKSLSSSYKTVETLSKKIEQASRSDQETILREKAREGIDFLIISQNQYKSLNINFWLLKDSDGIYAEEFKSYANQIIKDLHKIIEIKNSTENFGFNYYLPHFSILSREAWKPIGQKIYESILFKSEISTPIKAMDNGLLQILNNLAKFFANVDKFPSGNQVAALFYQMSKGNVPKTVWHRCKFNPENIQPDTGDKNTQDRAFLYGLKIDRHISKAEELQRSAWDKSTWIFRELAKPIPKAPTYFQSLMAIALALLIGNTFKPFSTLSLPNLIGFGAENPNRDYLKTIDALNIISKELPKNQPQSPSPKVNSNQVIQAIIETLDSQKNHVLDFDDKSGSKKSTQRQKWIKAVKEYQSTLKKEYEYEIEPTGNFITGDPTDLVLRCEISKRLSLTLDDDCQDKFTNYVSKIISKSDWDITKKSIQQLRDEFVKVHAKKPIEIETIISKILIIPTEESFLKKDYIWVGKIQSFQKEKSKNNPNHNGVIYPPLPSAAKSPPTSTATQNSDTYNILKCAIAKELEIELKEKPPICESLPEFKK
jgi:hypothetical protein